MTQEEIYQAEQDYKEYQRLVNTVEILTQAEYDLCKEWDAEGTWNYLFDLTGGRWLNTNVYSEADHHDRVFRMERGY